MNTAIRALILVALISPCGLAQIVVAPDPDLWNGGATNPSGEIAVPIVQYNTSNGEMWISTVGLNGVSDTVSRTHIAGDDVGVIAVSVEGPCPLEAGPAFTGFQDGILWNGVGFCGAKAQTFGVAAGAEFLRPTEGVLLFDYSFYAPDLGPDDFGVVEISINFSQGAPGTVMFGGVQFVPEPSGFFVAISFTMGLFFLRRTKQ